MPKSFRFLFFTLMLLLPAIAHADPVVPNLTITGGTITAGRGTLPGGPSVIAGISMNLTGIDPLTGQVFNIVAASEGAFSTNLFFALPGQTVTFVALVQGDADFAHATLHVSFSGFGPPIPNVIQPTLDLQGFGTATIHQATFYANSTDRILGQNPIFTISPQSFSGPVAMHFIWFAPGDPRFELRNATLTVEPVPEPASLILLVTSLAGLGVWRRRKIL